MKQLTWLVHLNEQRMKYLQKKCHYMLSSGYSEVYNFLKYIFISNFKQSKNTKASHHILIEAALKDKTCLVHKLLLHHVVRWTVGACIKISCRIHEPITSGIYFA